MHYEEGKVQIHKTVSVNEEDKKAFEKLRELGVKCYIQGVPTEEAIDLYELL